jgi:hypothetical protein
MYMTGKGTGLQSLKAGCLGRRNVSEGYRSQKDFVHIKKNDFIL